MDGLHFLVMVNNTVMNMVCMQISPWVPLPTSLSLLDADAGRSNAPKLFDPFLVSQP